jgi:hypothetical protein
MSGVGLRGARICAGTFIELRAGSVEADLFNFLTPLSRPISTCSSTQRLHQVGLNTKHEATQKTLTLQTISLCTITLQPSEASYD